MAFSEIELKRIERTVGDLCRRRSSPEVRDKLRFGYRISRHDVLIYETRPSFRDPSTWTESGIAKLRLVRPAGEWRLFWQRASRKWQSYEPLPSSRDLGELVAEVDNDPYACFFG